ncbi:MAG: peptide deformylase [Candidatus Omnitrophota bacterium]
MMRKAILAIRTLGDSCLRQPAMKLDHVGPSERILIQAMIKTLYDADGVGLAAPQIGINKQIAVIDVGNGPIVLVNPQIIKTRGEEEFEEGCLSIPGVSARIKRAKNVLVRFIDEQNRQQEMECAGLLARAVQHECDHLQGKLIIDYMSDDERQKVVKLFPDAKLN